MQIDTPGGRQILREVERAMVEIHGGGGGGACVVRVYFLGAAAGAAAYCAAVGEEPGLSTLAGFGPDAQSALLRLLRAVGGLRSAIAMHGASAAPDGASAARPEAA